MADTPDYDPLRGDATDDFADAIAGNASYDRAVARNGAARPQRNMMQGLVGVGRNQLLGMADNGKAELVRNIAGIVGLVRELATQVEGFGIEPFAGYARRTSGLVSELHDSVADKSVEALIDDGRALVRQQPEIAVVAAIVLGFLGARLVKARS